MTSTPLFIFPMKMYESSHPHIPLQIEKDDIYIYKLKPRLISLSDHQSCPVQQRTWSIRLPESRKPPSCLVIMVYHRNVLKIDSSSHTNLVVHTTRENIYISPIGSSIKLNTTYVKVIVEDTKQQENKFSSYPEKSPI